MYQLNFDDFKEEESRHQEVSHERNFGTKCFGSIGEGYR